MKFIMQGQKAKGKFASNKKNTTKTNKDPYLCRPLPLPTPTSLLTPHVKPIYWFGGRWSSRCFCFSLRQGQQKNKQKKNKNARKEKLNSAFGINLISKFSKSIFFQVPLISSIFNSLITLKKFLLV